MNEKKEACNAKTQSRSTGNGGDGCECLFIQIYGRHKAEMEFHPSIDPGANDAPAATIGSFEAEPSGLLTDRELAEILGMTVPWMRTHASDLPGFVKLGAYFRFHRPPLVQWLGGLDRLLTAEEAADLLNVPKSWVYANADQIPGVVRLGRYVRFRPATFHRFLAGSKVAQ